MFCVLNAGTFAFAQFPSSLFSQETLSGDWSGLRSTLQERGLTFELGYIGEVWSNLSGGRSRKTAYLDNVDLQLTLDAETAFGWQGASIFVYGLGNQGDDPSSFVGDYQTISNIEAPATWKLYEAWFQQNFFDNRYSLLVGLYDVSAEFDYAESAQLFVQSSFGTAPDFSQSGANGPSIFPTTSFGIRLATRPLARLYLQAAVLDGAAGDPKDPHGTQIIFGRDDGLLVTTEAAYLIGTDEEEYGRGIGRGYEIPYRGKITVGGWFYTEKFDAIRTIADQGKTYKRRGNHGVYGLAEYTVWNEPEHQDQALTFFVRIGFADSAVNQISLYTGGGAVYTGLLPGRDEDEVGFGIAAAHNGRRFKQAQRRLGSPVENSEIAFELTYRAQLTPWLALQPILAYVVNPGTDPHLHDAVVFGMRFEMAL